MNNYADYAGLEDDRRFIKIFELLMEISEKSNTLRQVVKGSYFIIKWKLSFFLRLQKNIDVKTLKDFEKEVRTKINNELEILRSKNDNISRVLMVEQ